MVVPFAPAATDVLARVLGAQLSELFGQPIIVEIFGGACGISAPPSWRSPPDGYQFVLGSAGTHAVIQTLYKHPLYNAMIDFTPLIFLVAHPIALITRKYLPARNLAAFIAYARANLARCNTIARRQLDRPACLCHAERGDWDRCHARSLSRWRAGHPGFAGRPDRLLLRVSTTAIPLITGHQVNAIALLTRTVAKSAALATAHEQALPISTLRSGMPFSCRRTRRRRSCASSTLPPSRRRHTAVRRDCRRSRRCTSAREPLAAYLQRFVESDQKLATAIKSAALAEQ